MSEEEILDKLIEFGDYLTLGTFFDNILRNIGWTLVLGMAWIIDSLENIADTILGLRVFTENPEILAFINQMQPLLIVMFAFNILFIGYLLIFQKEFNRAGVFANVFMALVIVVALGSGMEQGNEFTGDAIDAMNHEDGDHVTMANQIIQDNLTDIGVFDQNGWNTPELDERNYIETNHAREININSYLTEGSQITADEPLSSDGEEILNNKVVTFIDGSRSVEEIEDGGWITDISQEYYYRYTVDWINLLGTLGIMSLVLITVSVKLAQLFFELTFNYILAPFVAASDMHSGQRMKQVVQNILNIFLVTIMVFLSLKVYMIGTSFLGDQLSGLPYLIAMIGLAVAVMGGPNIVERLFGIDAGAKSGWGAIAGTYAVAKGATALGKGAMAAGKGLGLAGAGAAARNAMQGANGKNENVAHAANDKGNAFSFGKGTNHQQGNEHGQRTPMGEKEHVSSQAQNNKTSDQQGKGFGGSLETSAQQGGTGNESSSTNETQGNEQGNSRESSSSIHEDMKQKGKENSSTKPLSLHEEMKQKGATSASAAKHTANNPSSPPGTGAVANEDNNDKGNNLSSVNGQKSEGIPATSSKESSERRPAVDSEPSTESKTDTSSIQEQKQSRSPSYTTTTNATTGRRAENTATHAANSATNNVGANTEGEMKTSSVRDQQQVSGTGQVGNEMIDQQTDVSSDVSSGTVEQDVQSIANQRDQGGNPSTQQGAVNAASAATGGVAGNVSSQGAVSQGVSGTVGASSTSGEMKTSSVRDQQHVSGQTGQVGKEVIDQQTDVNSDVSSGTVEQDVKSSVNQRDQGGNPSTQLGTVNAASTETGSVADNGSSPGTTHLSQGVSGAGEMSFSSRSSGETKTSTVRNTQRQPGPSGAMNKEVIEEQNDIIQDSGEGTTTEQERHVITNARQESSGGANQVRQTTTHSGSSSSGSPSGDSSSGTVSSGSNVVAGGTSSTSGEMKTSTVRNTQRKPGPSGATNKEIIEEQNDVIQDSGGENTTEQERHILTTTRQESSGGSDQVSQTTTHHSRSTGHEQPQQDKGFINQSPTGMGRYHIGGRKSAKTIKRNVKTMIPRKRKGE
ncbi:pLS20_p028 family conjugation system transmembrane protein [Thalassobacillus sp. C254]|uniref:pLS20_p028 family conjugation system transmembrane protein n=1 Tax=Thalassobacillus sp. C254 TaxID=1225341 RepID=UPI0006D1D8CA|nr:hypothetical protein [Thalassobacillus sp. C254]